MGCKLLLFIYMYMESHTGFRLVPTVVILKDLKPRNGRYLASFHPKAVGLIRSLLH